MERKAWVYERKAVLLRVGSHHADGHLQAVAHQPVHLARRAVALQREHGDRVLPELLPEQPPEDLLHLHALRQVHGENGRDAT
jgi:hypothetical protein